MGLGDVEGVGGHESPVHPHVRGARRLNQCAVRRSFGPSPRAWGSVWVDSWGRAPLRSIPTCVGLGKNPGCWRWSSPVHPHVRGARNSDGHGCFITSGPSPRAWGSVPRGEPEPGPDRSIPTCVGLGLPDLRKLSPLPICNQNYRSDTRTCNNTVTLCGCPYGHGYSPTLTPAYAQHWLATLTSPEPNPM